MIELNDKPIECKLMNVFNIQYKLTLSTDEHDYYSLIVTDESNGIVIMDCSLIGDNTNKNNSFVKLLRKVYEDEYDRASYIYPKVKVKKCQKTNSTDTCMMSNN